MPRKKGQKPVSEEIRNRWLRECEGGKTPPKIAEDEEVDARTVRKQIDKAKREREIANARTMLIRGALENHNGDLLGLTTELENALKSHDEELVRALRDKPLCKALREHLPRSPIWRGIDKWEQLLQSLEDQKAKFIETTVKQIISKASRHSKIELVDFALNSVVRNRIEKLVYNPQLNLDKVATKDSTDGRKAILCERVSCAYVSQEKLQEIMNYFQGVLNNIDRSPECEEMKLTFAKIQRITSNVIDELTTIRLRQIVPGRCKYCPV